MRERVRRDIKKRADTRETEGGKFDVNVKSKQTIHKSKWRRFGEGRSR